ncbi:hypothetical protein H0H81_000034 [Sphagnurus paluster]|uniref:Uncharacterized protein n=1 Tax=Sphagnurus paluster TaxID=117069 RepID=A0A9P7FYZ9_9AGAR|nr:hypothetical protein H0H81_000034 [Sphagnurus paluster]
MSVLFPPNYTKTFEEEKKRLPTPSHRHAAPSAPWPWIDIHDELDQEQLKSELPPVPELCDHTTCGGCWRGYPQSRFPNWTPGQVARSKIADAIVNYDQENPCIIYHVDVNTKGIFTDAAMIVAHDDQRDENWKTLITAKRPENNRVRALFIQNLSGPILQMLGAKYNIEPFFFSSSLNWIPSRYQENPQPKSGDHITITLTFLKTEQGRYSKRGSSTTSVNTIASSEDRLTLTEQMIDTQSPLRLRSSRRTLVLDLLSVHLIRNVEGSTIISYHPSIKNHPTTEANYLHDRIRFAGQSVYWQIIFQKCPDPTFVLLTFVWHALYAWDEALQHLYNHICWLETKVLTTSDMQLTQELHVIRAHHLHYSSLLEDFEKTVKFIQNTHNPAMDSDLISETERRESAKLLKRECENLLSEIDRLEMGRDMQDKRLKNVMNLSAIDTTVQVFSSVNINDSRQMQKMTEAAVKDSADEANRVPHHDLPAGILCRGKYPLTTMRFSLTSLQGIFGMNVDEISPGTKGTLAHYLAVALPLTIVTIWVIVAFQSKHIFPEGTGLVRRFAWPVQLCLTLLRDRLGREKNEIPISTAGVGKSVYDAPSIK